MKIFLRRQISILLILWLIIVVVQFVLIYLSLDTSRNFEEVKHEILMILFIFFIIQFTLSILAQALSPYYLKKYLSIFDNLTSEIARGSYNIDINIEEYSLQRDKEMVESITSFKKMLDIVISFDTLKKQKIQEQRARIIALLNLTENGFLLLNKKGDIIYSNYLIAEHFPTIKENMNILESNFSLEVDRNIKSYITQVIKARQKHPPKNFYMGANKSHIIIKSEIVRDTNGDFDGAVIGIFNLLKKRPDPDAGKEIETKEELSKNDPNL